MVMVRSLCNAIALVVLLLTGDAVATRSLLKRRMSNELTQQSLVMTSVSNAKMATTTKHEGFICGMINLKGGKIVEFSAGAGVKVRVETVNGKPESVTLSGFIGGGITLGPPKIISGAYMKMREASAVLNLPNTIKTLGGGAKDLLWAAGVWALKRIAGREAPQSSMGKLAKLAKAKQKDLIQAVRDVPKNLKDAGFFLSEGEAFGAIAPITIEAAIKNDMEKQLADSLELFEKNLLNTLKEAAGTKYPTMDEHKVAIQKAYWLTYMDEKPKSFNPTPSQGILGTSSPDCSKVHLNVPSSVSAGHKPGFHNVLCVFMTHGYLLPDAVYSKLFRGKKGYQNTLNMINVVTAQLSEDLEAVYGDSPGTKQSREQSIAVFVESLELGKWMAPSSSPIVLRSLGEILLMNPDDIEQALHEFEDGALFQDPVDHSCSADKNKGDPKCGMVSLETETTSILTAGWGGGINFCTPDTSLLQYHYMRKRVYARNGSGNMVLVPKDSGNTHKIMIAGSIYFAMEINFKARPFKLTDVVFRIMVPSEDPNKDAKPEETGPKFEQFMAKNGVKMAKAIAEIFAAGAEVKALASKKKEKLVAAKDSFLKEIKDCPVAAAKKSFRSLRGEESVGGPTDPWWDELVTGLKKSVFGAATAAAGKLSSAVISALPKFGEASVHSVNLIGGELTLKRDDNGKWSGAKGGMFLMKYTEAAADSEPWLTLLGLGFDVAAKGYAGMTNTIEVEVDSVE